MTDKIAKTYGNLLAKDIVSVQPMSNTNLYNLYRFSFYQKYLADLSEDDWYKLNCQLSHWYNEKHAFYPRKSKRECVCVFSKREHRHFMAFRKKKTEGPDVAIFFNRLQDEVVHKSF